MIKLTVRTREGSQTHTFAQTPITLGVGNNPAIDLQLPDHTLEGIRLRILEQNGNFMIHNVANDPFTTLNSVPFGKLKLANRDLIHLGKVEILFEADPLPVVATIPEKAHILPDVSEATQLATTLQNLEKAAEESHGTEGHLDPHEAHLDEPHDVGMPWRGFLAVCGVVLLSVVVTAATIYIKALDKSEHEQLIAGRSAADVAMALLRAQVHQIKPEKQNWSDPNFIQSNLEELLAPGYASLVHLNDQGHLLHSDYNLRVYTNQDASKFLIIVQPLPSLLHWLIPRDAIVISSEDMEVYKVRDLKALNRLLVTMSPLDSASDDEILHIIKQGERLSLISHQFPGGFIPPKTLSVVSPGAEHKIYNAPRYYPFGDSVLRKAFHFLQMTSANNQEVQKLQQQLEHLAALPQLILYSSQSIQKTRQTQHILATLIPNHTFLTAYLELDDTAKILDSHLLIDHDSSAISSFAISPPQKENKETSESLTINPVPSSSEVALLTEEDPTWETESIDEHHPLLLQLKTLMRERKHALMPLNNKIVMLLNRNTKHGAEDFSSFFSLLSNEYEATNQRFQEVVTEKLAELYHQYNDLSLEQFATYVKAAGLEHLAHESLETKSQTSAPQERLTEAQFTKQMAKFMESSSFEELNQVVTETAGLLDLMHVPNHEVLIRYENEMRSYALAQVQRFLFSQEGRLPPEDFNPANRIHLGHILKTAWVTIPEECHFYLSEFDLLAQPEVR